MIKIDRQQVTVLSKKHDSKQNLGKVDIDLYPIFSHSKTNSNDFLKEMNTYQMAHWTNFSDRWISSQNTRNTKGYKRGSILFADLGATNFGHEPSYTHPVIVLSETSDSILIVPCSSKKYAKGFPEIIDATSNDGFSFNTGIQTKSVRWISKNRVISQMGHVTSTILDSIDAKLLTIIPSHTRLVKQLNSQIQTLTQEEELLKTKIAHLEDVLRNLQKNHDELSNKNTSPTD